MIRGSCLCGGFRFEVLRVVGPFEICHCNRCRKRSGSNALAMVGINAEDYRVISGAEQCVSYFAPVMTEPPAYASYFCSVCGSPLPPPQPSGWFEIPAGLLDDDPGVCPDRRIYTELAAPWDKLQDSLPEYTKEDLERVRSGVVRPGKMVADSIKSKSRSRHREKQ